MPLDTSTDMIPMVVYCAVGVALHLLQSSLCTNNTTRGGGYAIANLMLFNKHDQRRVSGITIRYKKLVGSALGIERIIVVVCFFVSV